MRWSAPADGASNSRLTSIPVSGFTWCVPTISNLQNHSEIVGLVLVTPYWQICPYLAWQEDHYNSSISMMAMCFLIFICQCDVSSVCVMLLPRTTCHKLSSSPLPATECQTVSWREKLVAPKLTPSNEIEKSVGMPKPGKGVFSSSDSISSQSRAPSSSASLAKCRL